MTRGVVKGVKEDFKVTLEKQVARCNESLEHVIRQFLVEERLMLQQNLLWALDNVRSWFSGLSSKQSSECQMVDTNEDDWVK